MELTPDDQNEMRYKIEIEPPMRAVMAQVVFDATSFGISEDQITRAVYRWVMERMVGGQPPSWFFQELDEIEAMNQAGPVE